MPVIKEVGLDRTNSASTFISRSFRNVFSQFGEDGAIERIFGILGEGDRWCVEFGAWDGRYLSNTCHLIQNKGWTGVQIEGSVEKFADLRRNFEDNPNVVQVNRMVGFTVGDDSLDDILAATPIAPDFDLISIDIDGNDFHVWESMVRHRPRVVVIEYNPAVPNRVVFVQDRDIAQRQGCSAAALVELGLRKGYQLVCALSCNLIFVRAEEFGKFGIADNNLDAMRVDVPSSIFSTFDGTLYNTLGTMGGRYKSVPVEPDALQVLPEDLRRFRETTTPVVVSRAQRRRRALAAPDAPASRARRRRRALADLNAQPRSREPCTTPPPRRCHSGRRGRGRYRLTPCPPVRDRGRMMPDGWRLENARGGPARRHGHARARRRHDRSARRAGPDRQPRLRRAATPQLDKRQGADAPPRFRRVRQPASSRAAAPTTARSASAESQVSATSARR